MQARPQPGPRAVASARAREAFLASFSREMRVALDDDGRLLLVEGPWPSILGWQPEQLHGWNWGELVHPADRVRLHEVFDRVAAAREPRARRRRAARPGRGRLPPDVLDLRRGLGHRQHRRPRPRLRRISRRGRGRGSLRPPAAAQCRARGASRRARSALRVGRAVRRDRRPPARGAAGDRRELGDPDQRGARAGPRPGAARPARRDRAQRVARSPPHGRAAGRRAQGRGGARRLAHDRPAVGRRRDALEPRGADRVHRAAVVVGPLPHVQADPALLEVVLDNLLSNALKYGPRSDGRIDISAERHPDHWRLSVTSGGKPIPAEEAVRIFQPFHRARSERRVPGIGLGLTICARLMERLGGAIGVEPGPTPATPSGSPSRQSTKRPRKHQPASSAPASGAMPWGRACRSMSAAGLLSGSPRLIAAAPVLRWKSPAARLR